MRIAYLIPEFPGQTHIWMWREMVHLREWGAQIVLFSTRHPPERDRARHTFADRAQRETIYLTDHPAAILTAALWALGTRPRALLACIWLALTLPVEARPRWRRVLPLVAPACLLARHMKRDRIEHLHCHTCANGAILAMMNHRLTRVPYSLTLNANLEWWGGAMAQKLGESRFTIAIAGWMLAQIRRDFPQLAAEQAILGRIGVDTRKWTPADPPDRPYTGPTRLVSVGRLHEGKGFDVLLRAVRGVLDRGHDLSLRIIGAGPQRPELESLVRDLHLGDTVTFLGSLSEDQIIEQLHEADVFVLASHEEPLGVVYMEAMALGVATIGTSAGGVSEIIDDGRNGLLTPPRQADRLVESIIRLVRDRHLRRSLAAAGRRTIVARFDSRLGAAVLYERLTGVKPCLS